MTKRADLHAIRRSQSGDDCLGDGWSWSARHLASVVSERWAVTAQSETLEVRPRKTGPQSGKVYIDVGGGSVLKLMALTHCDGIDQLLTQKYRSATQ